MIHPVVQQYALEGEVIFNDMPHFEVKGEFADTAMRVLSDVPCSDCTVPLVIKLSNTREFTYIEPARRLSDEIYRLDITKSGVTVTASCRRGVYRAINTLIRLAAAKELKAGYIYDYPLFPVRGYIEGFYGKLWQDDKRRSVLKLMAAHGMNTFYYAPKDDPYHRDKWRELYPRKELEALLELCTLAQQNEVDFYYCIAPGLTMRYTSEDDFNALIAKLTYLNGLGINRFGLLLDDIPEQLQYEQDIERYGETVNAHIAIINRVYSALKALNGDIRLTVCPLQYHGSGDEYFISKLGCGLDAEISVFWTGEEICSRTLTSSCALRFYEHTHHKPLYWDNYPVNDCEMFNEMHIGPVMGRDSDLWQYSTGLISNVMEYAECSKIPLITIADYLWNPVAYNKSASHDYALECVLGDKAELFKYFCDHLHISCLTKQSSVFLSETLEKANFELSRGDTLAAFSILTQYLDKAFECAQMLKDTDVDLFKELERWSKKFADCCDILRLCLEALCSGDEDTKAELASKAVEYDRDATLLTGFCLREITQRVLDGFSV